MKIFLGTDHAGFNMKEEIKLALLVQKHDVVDCGAQAIEENDDYPDFCSKVANGVVQNPGSMGIVFGRFGAGEVVAANKVKGVRATLAVNEENVRLSRQHIDANILSLGAIFYSSDDAKELVRVFLETSFEDVERHRRRIEKIKALEGN